MTRVGETVKQKQEREAEFYTIARQTIFQIYGCNGAPALQWESYPVEADTGYHLDRKMAIQRTKEEFEAEQLMLGRTALKGM